MARNPNFKASPRLLQKTRTFGKIPTAATFFDVFRALNVEGGESLGHRSHRSVAPEIVPVAVTLRQSRNASGSGDGRRHADSRGILFFWRESHFFLFKSEQGTKAAKEGKEDKKRERKRKNRLDPFLRLFCCHKMCPNEKKLKLSLVLKGGLRLRLLELAAAVVEWRTKP